jgi:DNA-binding winged helix-turn-helix (wHTH) protein
MSETNKSPTAKGDTKDVVSFGPFRLDRMQQLLLEGTSPFIRSRALDILILLLERPGELVTKNEIMARVWAGRCVESASLTVNICALRRALGDGHAAIVMSLISPAEDIFS